jgi:hypothetical protein
MSSYHASHPLKMTPRRSVTGERRHASGRASDLGGAEGTRTPDPLVANEVRYQLRYSPLV